MKEIKILELIYNNNIYSFEDSFYIRKLFSKFCDNDLFHNHIDNIVIYRYPLIQYKIIGKNLVVIGINEGADTLINNLHIIKTIKFKDKYLDDFICKENSYKIGTCDKNNYLFLTPWFALNSHNYKLYKNIDEQETLLKKILIGNILSFCKFMNYNIDERLEVDIDLKELISFYKLKPYNSFIGKFTVNINLPNMIGLGHLVSHGFGTIYKKNN
ncbi:MAG TPA: CRISPR-associated endonuclease Cas6 [Candidatus Kapabacteria bacterium]|nr:CRISPR-associated endonuclease Cas6 [Candidatus Kapabacteria bacterium]